MKHTTLFSLGLLITLFSIISCKKDAQNTNAVPATLGQMPEQSKQEVFVERQSDIIRGFIEDANHMAPSSPGTLLYEARAHQPVLAPDGHQLTLAEFETPKGVSDVSCTNDGTHIVIHMSNLIPNGVYTVWTLVWKAPGFDGTMNNLIGIGAAGPNTGCCNTFQASASGKGTLSVVAPAENLSMFGSLGSCAFDTYAVHFVAVYHINSKTYGPTPGPDGTAVEQFGFIYDNQK